ncbi:TrkA C-terminal domain-containing protein [Halorientalis salina]|uniref:TrkA C-terminal domain-containing protein n=1 Tax=Halorientalis salina TaxID=2932266 RepID=UPI0010AB86DB|nr:TrkA C-terminal domain-containing protein [Halorientalis salina]
MNPAVIDGATGPVVQTVSVFDDPALAISRLLGMAILAGALSGTVALVFRWYAHERVQTGLPVLIGLSGIAAYLNTRRALGHVITGTGPDPLSTTTVLFNITAFLVAGVAAYGAVSVGDRLGKDAFVATGARNVDGEISRVVEAVGRVLAVEMPEEIDDIVGYDPVPEETKDQLAGHTFLFPKRLTVAELETRLRTRLKAEYNVGHVDVDLADDGSVEYLALGTRAAGIGTTLPPETAAVAIRADPAFTAGAGDIVEVWTTGPADHVTTGEIRGIAGDVVTLAVDAGDAPLLDPDTVYRLVTLPFEPRADREFASLLRAGSETMSVVTVPEASPLAGQPLGSLSVTVIAIRTADGTVEPIPDRFRTIRPGDSLYAVARPEQLRKINTAADAPETGPPADGKPETAIED